MIEVIKHIPEPGPMIDKFFCKSSRSETSGSNIGYFERMTYGTKSKDGFFSPFNVIYHGFSSKRFKQEHNVKNDGRGYKYRVINPVMMPENKFNFKCMSRYKATKLASEIAYATEYFVLKCNDKPEFGLFLKTKEGSKCVLISKKEVLKMAKNYHQETTPEDELFIEEIKIKVTLN